MRSPAPNACNGGSCVFMVMAHAPTNAKILLWFLNISHSAADSSG